MESERAQITSLDQALQVIGDLEQRLDYFRNINRRLFGFLDILEEGVWIQGGNGKFYWANKAFMEITGYTLDELRERSTQSLIKDTWVNYVRNRNKLLLEGHLTGGYYFPAVRKDGSDLKVKGKIAKFGPGYIGIYTVAIAIDPEHDHESGLMDEVSFYKALKMKIDDAYKFDRKFLLVHSGIDGYIEKVKTSDILDFTVYFRSMGDKIKALASPASLCARIADRFFNIVLPIGNPAQARRQAEALRDTLSAYSSELSISLYNIDFSLSTAILEYDPEVFSDEFKIFINQGFKEVAKIEQSKV